MNKINTYAELLVERKRLEDKITGQKALINQNIVILKEQLSPFLYLLPALNIFKKGREGKPLLNWIASIGIDWLAGQGILSKSGWLARLLVPRVLKQVVSSALEKDVNELSSTPPLNEDQLKHR
jgi:hypothetical protein